MKYSVREATLADAEYLAPRLRDEDIAEIYASSGRFALDAITRGLQAGPAWVAEDLLGPIGIYGACPTLDPSVGSPWMLATPRLLKHQRQFVKDCPDAVARLQAPFRKMENMVDARNHVHVKWLAWCGFEFVQLVPRWGFQGLPFYHFERNSPVV